LEFNPDTSNSNTDVLEQTHKREKVVDDDKNMNDDWDVVSWPLVEEPEEKGGNTISSQFKFDVGWGSWRKTIFAWDFNITTKESG
jgi:hypothetical protein